MNDYKSTFKQENTKGKTREDYFVDKINQHLGLVAIDVSKNKKWRKADVDILLITDELFGKKFESNYKNIKQAMSNDITPSDEKVCKIEVKTFNNDNKLLSIEEVNQVFVKDDTVIPTDEQIKAVGLTGWWYESKADFFCFVDKKNDIIIILPNDKTTRDRYETIKTRYDRRKNYSKGLYGDCWWSYYYKISHNYFTNKIVIGDDKK